MSGDLISYTTQQNVWDELKGRIPRTFALAIGAAIMWMIVATALGPLHRDEGRAGSATGS